MIHIDSLPALFVLLFASHKQAETGFLCLWPVYEMLPEFEIRQDFNTFAKKQE